MAAEKETKKAGCLCPYCDEDIGDAYPPYCNVCRLDLVYCPECKKPVKRGNKKCGHCGAAIKG